MLKSYFVAALLCLGLVHPVFAQDAMMKCDDASMMKMQSDMDAMASMTQEQKDMAAKEMQMAKDAMAANKTDECMMRMENAAKAMKQG